MHSYKMPMLNIVMMFFILGQLYCKVLDTRQSLLSRQKRFLLFEEGVNWVQMVIGIGLPVELHEQSVTWGASMKSYYLLPTNSSIFTNPSIDVERKRRSTTRWDIYSTLAMFAERFGFGDGKACVLRAICEAALNPFEEKTGLFAEILNLVLTPSVTNDEVHNYHELQYHAAEQLGKTANNCGILFSECKRNIIMQFTKLFM